MRLLYFALLVIAQSAHNGDSANILAIAPLGARSHSNIMEKLLRKLAVRGHKVDFVTHFPSRTATPRYNEFSVRGSLPIFMNNMTIENIKDQKFIQRLLFVIDCTGPSVCEAIFNTKVAQELRNSTKKYDLLITHYFATNCMLGFAHLFAVPSIAVVTSVNLPWISSLIGLPDNPAYIPNYFAELLPKMDFTERLLNTLAYVITKIGYEIGSNTPSEVIARKFFGPQLPDLDDLARNMSLVLVNSHFSIHQPRPAVPNFVEVSGLHISENQTLTKYFEESMETDSKGIIYMSFGSMVVTESFSEEVLTAFFNVFERLPYKILWKASRERFPKHLTLPTNIQFEPWMPQMEILCHPKVKLFISHGGMLGTSEALYCAVPILGVPLFADQMLNIQNNVGKGIGIGIPYTEITENKLMDAIQSLLNNPKYKASVEKISRLFKDRPMSALDTAIYWVEYVVRHNGAPHLRSMGADLPWYQYYLVDVILTLIICVTIVCFVLYKLLAYILFKIFILTHKIKVKKE